MRKYKIALFSVFLFGMGRQLFGFIASGYFYKNILDTLSKTEIPINERLEISLAFLLAMAISLMISVITPRYSDYVYFRFLSKAHKDIYDLSFSKLLQHSYSFFTNNFAGSLVTKVKRFAQSLHTVADVLFANFWPIITSTALAAFSLYFQSKVLSLYILIWSLIYFLIVLFFTKKKIQLDIKVAEADSKITGFLADTITNVLNIKIFSAFRNEENSFGETSANLRDRSFATYRYYVIRSFFQAFLMVSFHIFILYTMINLWHNGEISIGIFVMAYVYIVAIFDRIWDLSHSINKFMEALTNAKEMIDIFDKVPSVLDIKNPEKLDISKGDISLESVHFEYIEDRAVFENFNLKIKAGEKVGLVGHSGSGKSTFTKMLLRFADVKKGKITIDGQDISKITQDDLRSVISYVPQDPILFHRSIKENIAYSNPNATESEIIESSKKAHCHEFITKLPNGYDTLVGERGVKLSGGERQRVAIARAMLKDAPIIVLDEATSSLDSMSESYIQEAFSELMKGKTAIVIAHRLSTIQKMDRIIVLDNGKITEEGTHKELLAKDGMYSKLWNQQTGGFLE